MQRLLDLKYEETSKRKTMSAKDCNLLCNLLQTAPRKILQAYYKQQEVYNYLFQDTFKKKLKYLNAYRIDRRVEASKSHRAKVQLFNKSTFPISSSVPTTPMTTLSV